MTKPAIGVLGGSGFHDLPRLTGHETVEVDTPFGRPLAEFNTRADLYALEQLGATHVVRGLLLAWVVTVPLAAALAITAFGVLRLVSA